MLLWSLAKRMFYEADRRLVFKLLWNLGVKGFISVQRHKIRLKRGEYFPPFLYVSIINSCNLRCQGCWVDVAAKQEIIPPAGFHRMVKEANQMGNTFFGIVGGEPFMHPHLLDMLAEHPKSYFQIFTNGHFITEDRAKRMHDLGNITPLISIEGTAGISDIRRGRNQVYQNSMRGIENCLKHRVLTGVCTSLCANNIDDMLQEKWLDQLIELGVMYTWFHVYRPMGPNPNPDLCLSPEQSLRARQFVVEMRAKKPIIIIDAYHDGEGNALCPAATGISHHISPWGAIEPCPIVQFSKESIYQSQEDNRSLRDKFIHSEFLHDFRQLAQETTRGCIVLERPDLLKQLIEKHAAPDSTARKTALQELSKMAIRTSQFHPFQEVPEKNWLYRIAKRICFNDFGVYEHLDTKKSAPALLGKKV